MTRTKRSILTFSRAFRLNGTGRPLPAGAYELVTDEEMIEGLSFPAYRRVASWIVTEYVGIVATNGDQHQRMSAIEMPK